MKYVSTLVFILSIGVVVFQGACTSDVDLERNPVQEKVEIQLSPATRAVAETLEPTFLKYTTDVIRHSLNHHDNPINLSMSPLSATMLLALVANGVDDESRKEITDYLGTEDIEGLNEFCRVMLTGLPQADPNVTIDMANSIWVNKFFNLSPNEHYLSILDTYFQGDSFNYDFEIENSRLKKDLREWFSTNTNRVIPLPEEPFRLTDSSTIAILLNSLYFQAPWDIFSPDKTKKGEFHGSKRPVLTDMMTSKSLRSCPYYRDEDFEVFCLSFRDSAYSLYIVLPAENVSLKTAVDRLTPEFYNTVMNEMVSCTLTVTMPKFRIASYISLGPILAELGVSSFLNGKSYTMFNNPVPADTKAEISQGSVVAVNEKGAEASAVTNAFLSTSASNAASESHYTINVDRPFLFYIREKNTRAWISSGYFADPDM